jgi:hypothetical protein
MFEDKPGKSDDHRQDDEHRPDKDKPKPDPKPKPEPPGHTVKPRPAFGQV